MRSHDAYFPLHPVSGTKCPRETPETMSSFYGNLGLFLFRRHLSKCAEMKAFGLLCVYVGWSWCFKGVIVVLLSTTEMSTTLFLSLNLK